MSFLGHDDDAVQVAPDVHEVVFENDELRVLKVTVAPGTCAEMHWHPRNINYVLAGGTLRFTKADGSAVDVELTAEQVTSSEEGRHAVENTGNSEVQTVQVEQKQ